LISGGVSASAFADLLLRTADVADIACLLIAAPSDTPAGTLRRVIDAVMPPLQARNVAVLIEGHASLAKSLGADGVHLAEADDYAEARKTLGPDAIVGLASPIERHAAMEIAETGGDYLLFDIGPAETVPDVLAWWAEMMTVPLVARGQFKPADCAGFVAANIDFLAPDAGIWKAADPVAEIAALAAAIRAR
jgi:thiamine-phosphate pyrophosphorylase